MPGLERRVQRIVDRCTQLQQQRYVPPVTAADVVYHDDCLAWMRDQVYTIDEASQALRPWPTHTKPYLAEVVLAMLGEPMLVIPKSRRMLVSWTIAAYCTWRARYYPDQLLVVQSETEEKAAYLVGNRCQFIEEHVPVEYQRPMLTWRTKKGLTGKIRYPQMNSEILSVAQGANAIRSYTFSLLVMDETEFQPEARQALVSALPAVEKGARIILVSSPHGPQGVVAELCKQVNFTRWSG